MSSKQIKLVLLQKEKNKIKTHEQKVKKIYRERLKKSQQNSEQCFKCNAKETHISSSRGINEKKTL